VRAPEELAELQVFCPGTREIQAAGGPYYHLPRLEVVGGLVVEGLLCPQAHSN
jgi:hypothetical protein